MLNEVFKILIDKPEKATEAVLRLIKVTLAIIIAQALYTYFAGKYVLLSWTDTQGIIDYFLHGRFLICMFFYFLSRYPILGILQSIYNIPLYFITNKSDPKIDNDSLRYIVQIFKVIEIDKAQKKILPGKNFEYALEFFKVAVSKEGKEEIKNYRNSFIDNVWNLYCSFIIIYYIQLQHLSHNKTFNTIVVILFIILLLIHTGLHAIESFITSHIKELQVQFETIQFQKIVQEQFEFQGINLKEPKDENGLRKFKYFELKGKEYYVFNSMINKRMTKRIYDESLFLEKFADKPLIFILHESFIGDTQLLLNHPNANRLIIIKYKDEADMIAQIQTSLDQL